MQVEAKEVNGTVPDVVKETTNWLQNYFSNGLSMSMPKICVLSDSKRGKYVLGNN